MSRYEAMLPPEIRALRARAKLTPDRGEGSRGHLRDEFVWQLEEDYRRASAGDESVRDEYGDERSLAQIMVLCREDALRVLVLWAKQDGGACWRCPPAWPKACCLLFVSRA